MRPAPSLFRVLAPPAAALWLVACPLTTQGPPAPPGPPTEDPWRPLIDASLLQQFTPRIQWQHGQPRNVFVDVSVPASVPADPVARALWFLDAHSGVYGFADVANDLFLRRTEVRGDTAHVFFGQLLGGREVFASDVIVHLVGDHVRSTTLVRSAGPAMFDPPAVDAPRAQFIASRGQGTGPGQPVGTPRLVVFDRAVLDPASPSSARLAWDVTVEDSAAENTWTTFVDASTGVVLLTLGWEVNHGAPTPQYAFFDEFPHGRPESGDLTETTGFVCVCSAGLLELRDHYVETYAFFHDRYGRHGWDGTDGRKRVRFIPGYENAAYRPADDTLAFGYGYQLDDVVGHEFTHAMIDGPRTWSETDRPVPSRRVWPTSSAPASTARTGSSARTMWMARSARCRTRGASVSRPRCQTTWTVRTCTSMAGSRTAPPS
jgi:Thermolysin metallopeptidase, catalytic domain